MPKFVPRQRKHKVLARSKSTQNTSSDHVDTNVVEHVPLAKSELHKQKELMTEQLRSEGSKISSKKAKRLEKYIENKLKKDENRELIERLAKSKTDTSLFRSTRTLGQGRHARKSENKYTRVPDAEDPLDEELELDSQQVGNGTKPARAAFENAASEASDEEGPRAPKDLPTTYSTQLGAGLKRSLDQDDEGHPVIKKRKLRGGVKSKLDRKIAKQASEEPEWSGFDSSESGDEDEAQSSRDGSSCSEETGSSDSSASDSEEEESSSASEEDPDSADGPTRSSAFKAWATAQINDAQGFVATQESTSILDIPKIPGFKARPREEDPLPMELQPTTNVQRKSNSISVTRPAEIQEARLQLPVVAEEQKIMEAIHNNNIVVVQGATGSGKTTQIPQFLFEAGYGSPNSETPGLIGITQPRRVAAVSMAKRVGVELGEFGDKVAYQIRFEGNVGANTVIKFMTDGVLLREVAQDVALRKYSAIVIDEAHERTVNTDILVGMLSRVVKLREEMALEKNSSTKPLKLIIMSATLRITDFTLNQRLFTQAPPVLQAQGRQHSVSIHFARKTHQDYLEDVFIKISKGHRKLPPGSMLVFLTGQGEITYLSKRLREAFATNQNIAPPQVRISGNDAPTEAEDVEFGDMEGNGLSSDDEDATIALQDDEEDFNVEGEPESGPAKMHVLPLYSLLPTKEQLRVFDAPPKGSRMVVLATNVAETSLTIPGVRYVFDCGRSKERKYNKNTGVQSYEVGWISKASANQRAGRAGRTGPGHCYRLYSSAVYERDFADHATPEIMRMPIEGVVLQLKAMNLQHVINFPFPTPPDQQSLTASERLLQYLSAISPSGQITSVGTAMSIFPLAPRYAKILLIGHLHDCLPYTIAMVAGLSAAEVFLPENHVVPAASIIEENGHMTNADRLHEDHRAGERKKFNQVQRNFCFLDDKSDAIKLLQVVGEYAHEPTEVWCQAHYVRHKVLKEIAQLRRQITALMRANIAAFAGLTYEDKLDPPSAKQVKALKQMVAAGFIDHVAIRADLTPNPPEVRRKPSRAIDVPYITLLPSHQKYDDEDKAVYIHPSSPLAHLSIQECPDYIIYSYLQRADTGTSSSTPRTRMHALTDITGSQLASLAKGTPLIQYGKPIKEIDTSSKGGASTRECWVVPYLRATKGDLGWPLPARKVVQRKVAGQGWVVD